MSQELEARNKTMAHLYATGKSMQDIADMHGISRQRAAQIISRYARNEIVDDDERSLHRLQLEWLLGEMLAVVNAGPAPAVNVKGQIIYDADGCMVMDYEGFVKAADEARKISESIRRMDALDKPRRKQMAEEEARRQMETWLASLPRAEVTEQ